MHVLCTGVAVTLLFNIVCPSALFLTVIFSLAIVTLYICDLYDDYIVWALFFFVIYYLMYLKIYFLSTIVGIFSLRDCVVL